MPKKRNNLAPEDRFQFINDEELQEKREGLKNKNTKKSNAKWDRCFTKYLEAKQLNTEFWTYEAIELDTVLSKFWFEVRTCEGDYYKIGSLESLRYGINRCLEEKGCTFDIVHGEVFRKCQTAFNDACKELKKLGYGVRDPYKEIKSLDLIKLYNHPELDPDLGPRQLLNKVQFDIRFYLCRRGSENFHEMDKTTFELQVDVDSGIPFVKKVKDEMTKNHKDKDTEVTTGFMPQVIDPTSGRPHKMCPVRSFENYVSHLNPNCNKLWQTPLKKIPQDPNNTVWYKRVPLGHNPLDQYLSKLSITCQLSDYYTNHCIRVTGITKFKREHCSDNQIMAVSGHKSVQSLTMYQRVHDDEKLMMGFKLTYSLLKPDEAKLLREVNDADNQPQEIQGAANNVVQVHQAIDGPPPAKCAKTTVQPEIQIPVENAVVPFNPEVNQPNPESIDFDILQLINDIETDEQLILAATQMEQTTENATATKKSIVAKKNSPNKPNVFTGCTFGNVGTLNIHIHKH